MANLCDDNIKAFVSNLTKHSENSRSCHLHVVNLMYSFGHMGPLLPIEPVGDGQSTWSSLSKGLGENLSAMLYVAIGVRLDATCQDSNIQVQTAPGLGHCYFKVDTYNGSLFVNRTM